MNKKIKKIIILLIILLLISILSILVYYVINSEKIEAKEQLEYINDSSEWDTTILYPEGAPVLKRSYEGELTIKDIGKSMYNFALKIIPKYYNQFKNSTNEEIEKYFNDKKDIILIETGIISYSDFESLIMDIKALEGDAIEFESFKLDTNSIGEKASSVDVDMYIKYKNNQNIKINADISNEFRDNTRSSIIYTSK